MQKIIQSKKKNTWQFSNMLIIDFSEIFLYSNVIMSRLVKLIIELQNMCLS